MAAPFALVCGVRSWAVVVHRPGSSARNGRLIVRAPTAFAAALFPSHTSWVAFLHAVQSGREYSQDHRLPKSYILAEIMLSFLSSLTDSISLTDSLPESVNESLLVGDSTAVGKEEHLEELEELENWQEGWWVVSATFAVGAASRQVMYEACLLAGLKVRALILPCALLGGMLPEATWKVSLPPSAVATVALRANLLTWSKKSDVFLDATLLPESSTQTNEAIGEALAALRGIRLLDRLTANEGDLNGWREAECSKDHRVRAVALQRWGERDGGLSAGADSDVRWVEEADMARELLTVILGWTGITTRQCAVKGTIALYRLAALDHRGSRAALVPLTPNGIDPLPSSPGVIEFSQKSLFHASDSSDMSNESDTPCQGESASGNVKDSDPRSTSFGQWLLNERDSCRIWLRNSNQNARQEQFDEQLGSNAYSSETLHKHFYERKLIPDLGDCAFIAYETQDRRRAFEHIHLHSSQILSNAAVKPHDLFVAMAFRAHVGGASRRGTHAEANEGLSGDRSPGLELPMLFCAFNADRERACFHFGVWRSQNLIRFRYKCIQLAFRALTERSTSLVDV